MTVASAVLTDIRHAESLYEQGLYVQSLTACGGDDVVRESGDPAELVLSANLATQLGAARLGRVRRLLNYRRFPDLPRVQYYGAVAMGDYRGDLAAWEFMAGLGEPETDDAELRSDWCGLQGTFAAGLRDFDTAHEAIERGRGYDPGNAYLWVEYAFVLQEEDRRQDALEAAQHALDLRPSYRPAVQLAAYNLSLLGRDEEAVRILTEAGDKLESCWVAAQLAQLHSELGNYAECVDAWHRFEQLAVLLPLESREWFAANISDACYRAGEFEEAKHWASEAGETYRSMQANVDARPDGQRVVLPVGFIRQNHLTCAPTTLAILGDYWSKPTDHIELADEICYDGTPHHSQRQWAEESGWTVREFTVTWDAARALIDRGVPFAISTVEPGSAHLAAIIGYDSRRGTLISRDPSFRHYQEYLTDKFLERYASTGPRGMAMVPHEECALLNGIDLADCDFYDRSHELQGALERHDRDTAEALYQDVQSRYPEQAVHLRRSLAAYDADTPAQLECLDVLIKRYPADVNHRLSKLDALAETGTRQARWSFIEESLHATDNDPLLREAYARELATDARELEHAERLLRSAARERPGRSSSVCELASIRWMRGDREGALHALRFAACMEIHKEASARYYLSLARLVGQRDEALEFLQRRVERLGANSTAPVQTLFWAYEVVGRATDAFGVLEEALRSTPDDASLLLFAADAFARIGRVARARELLEAARSSTSESSWLRVSASVARYDGDLRAALATWRLVLELEPLAVDALSEVVDLVEATADRSTARQQLEEAAARFPHHSAVQKLLIGFLGSEPPAEAEEVIRQHVEHHPVDTWSRRELALNLARARRYEEALREAECAVELDPTDSVSHCVLGFVAACMQDDARARASFRRALDISIDYSQAFHYLLQSCRTHDERRVELEWVASRLEGDLVTGDGVLAYYSAANDLLDRETVLTQLRELQRRRPDLWQTWVALAEQLHDMHQLDESLVIAEGAVERFGLCVEAWRCLASAHEAHRDIDSEREALEHLLEICPDDGIALRRLALSYERTGQYAISKEILSAAVERNPLDCYTVGCLADALWQCGERGRAIETVRRAVALDPTYSWAWTRCAHGAWRKIGSTRPWRRRVS